MNKPGLTLKITPRLILTPNLRQAITLLELPMAGLRKYIEEETAKNPLFQHPGQFSHSYGTEDRFSPAQADKGPSLYDYLNQQLRLSGLTAEELQAAKEISSGIDNNGYLRDRPDELSRRLGLPLEKIYNIINTIQSLEPSGIGAKDLRECLLIQLKNADKTGSLEFQIVERCFNELAKRKYGLISKKLKRTETEILLALKEIKRLNPRPGSGFSRETPIRVIPDVIIGKEKGGIKITLNRQMLPELELNDSYLEILRDSRTSKQTKQLIRKHLSNARWLIKAISQRNQNMLKVAREIAKRQSRAIFQDISHLRPLTLEDIARKTGLHISTVGRIVKDKYISTPRGAIKLKELFSTKHYSKHGNPISAGNIAAKLKKIISRAKTPLTDREIAGILQKEGIPVSRRTVAKYRDKLRIRPSFLRQVSL